MGSFHPKGPGSSDSVETGSMLNPETNVETPYEEVWRSLPASFTERFGVSWILRSKDQKTFLGRVGGCFLALKGGNEDPVGAKGFCARRETWDDKQGCWTLNYDAGDSENLSTLPSMRKATDFTWEERSKEGDVVEAFGQECVVCALENIN